jgi:putative redox protein
MEIIVRHIDNVKFEVQARGHRLVCDQPFENRGTDAGMTAPELLLASLGACAGHYAAEYLSTRGLPTEGLEVRVSAQKAKPPARLASFLIQITVPDLEERHETGILRAVKACVIHNTLLNMPQIDVAIESRVPATIG